MQSEGLRMLTESKKPHPLARVIGAHVYGLLFAALVLLVLRGELVSKFALPLLYSTATRLEYSLDAADWRQATAAAGSADTFEITPPEGGYNEPLLLRASDPTAPLYGGADADVKMQYSADSGATWTGAIDYRGDVADPKLKAEKAKAAHPEYPQLAPDPAASRLLVRVTPAESAKAAAVLVGLDRSLALSWLTAGCLVVVAGLLLARLVLALGYFRTGARIATLVFFTVFGVTMVVPFLWMVSTALKTSQDASLFVIQWIPSPIRWVNFSEVFTSVPFARFFINSAFMSCYVTLGLVFTSSLAAYSFARLDFPGRDKLFMAYLGTMMIPGAVTSIPVFVLMCSIGWVDSYKAIIIPGIFSAYGTFMLRQFFMTLPRDLEDAAKIDGCSLFGIFWRIIIPLSKPAIATLTIFTFMGEWNDFMWPLIILNDPKKMPLQVGIQLFSMQETPDPNVLMAAAMMAIVPVIIIFIVGQRYFVEGIQLGAVKG